MGGDTELHKVLSAKILCCKSRLKAYNRCFMILLAVFQDRVRFAVRTNKSDVRGGILHGKGTVPPVHRSFHAASGWEDTKDGVFRRDENAS